MYAKYPGEADLKTIRSHLFKFLYKGLTEHTDLRSELGSAKGFDAIKAVVDKLKERREG